MDTKIPVQVLADKVAAKAGVDSTVALKYIKDLFASAADLLAEGKACEISGIGRFIPTLDPNNPVEFEPYDTLAAKLNAPFLMFEPVEIADEVTEQMLGDVDDSVAVAEEEEPIDTEAEVAHQETIDEVVVEEVVVEEVATEVEVEDAADAEDEAKIETEADIEPPVYVPAPLSDETADSSTEEDKTEVIEEVEPTPEQPEEPDWIIPEDEEEFVSDTNEYDYSDEPRTKSRFWIGFVVGLIVGLAIGFSALFGYALWYVNQ